MPTPTDQIIAVTCQRDDGPYMVEWVAHHLAAGFDHIVILTHDCQDGSDGLADALSADPRITHVPFQTEGDTSVQWQALRVANGLKPVKRADWAMFFDLDEFLVLRGPASVRDLIAACGPEVDAIPLRWRFFGAAGQVEMSTAPTLSRFTRAAPTDIALPAAHFIKTLFRPAAFQKMGVHRPKTRKGDTPRWQSAANAPLPPAFADDDARINLFGVDPTGEIAVLHHYSVRSAAEFMVKRQRGLPNRTTKALDLGYWAERNFNTTPCDDAAPMIPATLAAMEALFALPDVRARHEAAIEWHRAQFAALMRDPANVQFLWHLQMLGTSTPPSPAATNAHLNRLMAAKERPK